MTEMTTYTDPIIENAQFQQIVESEDFATPCDNLYHEGDDPAEWIVLTNRPCHCGPRFRLWCSDCLRRDRDREGEYWMCVQCGGHYAGRLRDYIVSVEPLTTPRNAA